MLIGVADTEGGTNGNNNLWDFYINFLWHKNSKKTENIFHCYQFSCSKNFGDTKKPMKHFENSIKYLMRNYKTDKLVLLFWNKAHDVAVLKRAGFTLPFIPLCLMQHVGKQKLNGPHSALGDVNKMLTHQFNIENILKKQYFNIEKKKDNELEDLTKMVKKSMLISKPENFISKSIQKSKHHKI